MRFDRAEALPILERTPALLDHWLRGLPPAWTSRNEGGDSWSAFDIVGHLNDGEETDWMPRARQILEGHGDTPFAPFDRLRHRRLERDRTLEERLDRFRSLRTSSLASLRELPLTMEALSLTGLHPAFGRVRLDELLATWVAHDLGHIAQVARVMAVQYREAVGPWSAYLPVLALRAIPEG